MTPPIKNACQTLADVDFTLENPCFATLASFYHAFKKESNLRVEYQKRIPGNNSSFRGFSTMIARLRISRRKITGLSTARITAAVKRFGRTPGGLIGVEHDGHQTSSSQECNGMTHNHAPMHRRFVSTQIVLRFGVAKCSDPTAVR